MTTIGNAAHAAEAALATETNKLALLHEDAGRINRALEDTHGRMEEIRIQLERELAACNERTKDLNNQLAENGRQITTQQERVAKAQLFADTARELGIEPEQPADLNPLGQPQEYAEFEQQTRPDVPVANGSLSTQHMQPVGEGQ